MDYHYDDYWIATDENMVYKTQAALMENGEYITTPSYSIRPAHQVFKTRREAVGVVVRRLRNNIRSLEQQIESMESSVNDA